MDFFQIRTREIKRGEDKGSLEVYPDFVVGRTTDLMVQGKQFKAIWDEKKGLWSKDEYDVQRLVDEALDEYAKEHLEKSETPFKIKHLHSFTTNQWTQFRKFVNHVSDNSHNLDTSLTFANTEVKKNDYASVRLPYPLEKGDYSAWDEIIGTLYTEEERAKIEWAIGAIVSGDSRKIQKFLVFYGKPGSGKGTILDIIYRMFEGYTTVFNAKALVGGNNSFSTEPFMDNPLVAIQFDGDLSNIQDNTILNQIISHEDMSLNAKYKPLYKGKVHSFLLMGSNHPVRITNAKSGLIRRLIDVSPSGKLIPVNRYNMLMQKVDFEFGAIAMHCLNVYRKMGKNYYIAYKPMVMMQQTDVFYNFIESKYDIFKTQDGVSLKQAYEMYKEYCNESGIEKPLPRYKIRAELEDYFEEFEERHEFEDGTSVRSYFSGFTPKAFKTPLVEKDEAIFSLVLDETESLLDELLDDRPAQYAKEDGTPEKYWDGEPRIVRGEMITPKPNQIVSTTLKDLATSREHFVKPPENLIVIDFDIRDENGNKSADLNLEAASKWPATYAEFSRGGAGIHLHYIYEGDREQLAPIFADGIEVKVFSGNSSLRRRLSKCNSVPIATISSGLPLKEKKLLKASTIQSERGLRELLAKIMRKEVLPGTKPSVEFMHKVLEEEYNRGVLVYDVSDLKNKMFVFANNSTHHALHCLQLVQSMKFKSDPSIEVIQGEVVSSKGDIQPMPAGDDPEAPYVFWDIEIFPNLFVLCYKYEDDPNVIRMINPTAQEVEALFSYKLIGFNNRRYDNHIAYARYMGYDLEDLYRLSKKIIDGSGNALFGEAYNLSYADIYDFSSKKQSLKKWEIDLGIHHVELDIPWDQPVPKELWMKVVEYCVNDVLGTEATFKACRGDFIARQILADLSGLTVNDTTARHTAKIIFGDDRNPQKAFNYTDLSKDFPGYVYDFGKSTYRGELVGEGGLVRAKPGIHENVALLDVASMHPTSIIQLNLFGDYTPNFTALVDAQLALKRGDFETAKDLLDGKLIPYIKDIEKIEDPEERKRAANQIRYALKIAINIVYGLTSAKFDNPFKDNRNKDNIVAKRGALFMIDLMHAIEEQGFTVAHIKTDSVKIPNATPEIIEFVKQFGQKYGYAFEYDPDKDFYDKMCLVNDAVYIARHDECLTPEWVAVDYGPGGEANYRSNVDTGEHCVTHWTAVGAQFQHPYVFKKLFSHADIEFDDLCETKAVIQGALYLDFDSATPMAFVDGKPNKHFVGRTGRFIPVKEGSGGGILYRVKDGKSYAAAGTKGYFWIEAEMANSMEDIEIDKSYFEHLAEDAVKAIEKFGSFEEFVK